MRVVDSGLQPPYPWTGRETWEAISVSLLVVTYEKQFTDQQLLWTEADLIRRDQCGNYH